MKFDDGHPLEVGYEAYAQAAFDHILTEPDRDNQIGIAR